MIAWKPTEFSRFRLQYNFDDADHLVVFVDEADWADADAFVDAGTSWGPFEGTEESSASDGLTLLRGGLVVVTATDTKPEVAARRVIGLECGIGLGGHAAKKPRSASVCAGFASAVQAPTKGGGERARPPRSFHSSGKGA